MHQHHDWKPSSPFSSASWRLQNKFSIKQKLLNIDLYSKNYRITNETFQLLWKKIYIYVSYMHIVYTYWISDKNGEIDKHDAPNHTIMYQRRTKRTRRPTYMHNYEQRNKNWMWTTRYLQYDLDHSFYDAAGEWEKPPGIVFRINLHVHAATDAMSD